MKKKFIVSILVLCMSIGLVACGGSDASVEEDTTEYETEDDTEEVEEDDTEYDTEEVAEDDTEYDTEEVAEDDTEEVAEEETEETEEATVIQVPISIINATGVDIAALYISGSGTEEWGDELLAGQTMAQGSYMDLVLNVDQNNLAWDLTVEDSEGNSLVWYNIDISEMSVDGFCIELLWDGSEGTANVVSSIDELQGDYSSDAE